MKKYEIKVGDTVEHINGNFYKHKLHNVVTSISGCGTYFRVNNEPSGIRCSSFKVVDTSKHHKHHDLIIAWAKGAEIEFFSHLDTWVHRKHPSWDSNIKYRVKPTEPTGLEKLIQEHKAMGETIDKLTKELMND
jgi:hypothetical protein